MVHVPCNVLCVVFAEETSGSEEETMHYYSPSSDLRGKSRKKKKPRAQSKTSQSLFSVLLSVNHGLVSLQTNAKVSWGWIEPMDVRHAASGSEWTDLRVKVT